MIVEYSIFNSIRKIFYAVLGAFLSMVMFIDNDDARLADFQPLRPSPPRLAPSLSSPCKRL